MKGWISIYRQIQDNWIWKSNEPFDKRSAWIDLLLQANYEDKIIKFDGKILEVKKGSFITSEIKLSNKWKWSRKKVRTFLEALERDNMLAKKSTTKYTTLTIENWELYQIEEQQKEHQKNNKRDTDNNINNIYINLFNKYKSKIEGQSFAQHIHWVNECQKDDEYMLLNAEEQRKLFSELMSLK